MGCEGKMQDDGIISKDAGDGTPPNCRQGIPFVVFHGILLPCLSLARAVFFSHGRISATVFVAVGVSFLLSAVRNSSTTVDDRCIEQWSLFRRRRIAWMDLRFVYIGHSLVILRSRDALVWFLRWRFVHDDAVVQYILRKAEEARSAMTGGDGTDRLDG